MHTGRKYFLTGIICLMASAIFSAIASASITVYTNRASWQPNLQGPTTDTFEADAPASYPTPFLSVHGTRVSTVSGGAGTVQVLPGGSVNGSREIHFREFGPGMNLALDAPARGFGFSYDTATEPWDLVVNGTVVATLASNTTGFVGVVSDSGTIASFVLRSSSPSQGGISVDSLSAGAVLTSQQLVANYVRNNVLGGSFGPYTLWMTDATVGTSYVARNISPSIPDVTSPYAATWWVMVDSIPTANWAHGCLWVAVRSDLAAHQTFTGRRFPPAIRGGGGSGPARPFSCIGVTPNACTSLLDPPSTSGANGIDHSCLHAVLVSGGWNAGSNYQRYRDNLISMYQRLRALGYAKSNIFVYYADGASLDLDNLDGDGSHATGGDVTGAADEALIRAKISSLCTTLDPASDVLFLYTSNHGASTADPLMLWDLNNNNSFEASESYTVAELQADTRDCKVCRLYMLLDQCFSGAFTTMVGDAHHANTAIYTAASSVEVSWGREYVDCWEDYNLAGTTMNELHNKVLTQCAPMSSHPQMAEGTPGNGDFSPNDCWGTDHGHTGWDFSICENQSSVDVPMQVWNTGTSPRTYTITFTGLPVGSAGPGGGCSFAGPTSFTMVDPPTSTFTIAGNTQRDITVRIGKPVGLTPGKVACYRVSVHNVEDNYTFGFRGSLWGIQGFCPNSVNPFQAIGNGSPADLRFLVRNLSNPSGVFDYGFVAMSSDLNPAGQALSLNGLPPGQIVTGSVTIPMGSAATISVSARFLASQPNRPYDVQLLWDIDGNSTMEPVASMGVISNNPLAMPMINGPAMMIVALLLLGSGLVFVRRQVAASRTSGGASEG